jgi:hypothetical protein
MEIVLLHTGRGHGSFQMLALYLLHHDTSASESHAIWLVRRLVYRVRLVNLGSASYVGRTLFGIVRLYMPIGIVNMPLVAHASQRLLPSVSILSQIFVLSKV